MPVLLQLRRHSHITLPTTICKTINLKEGDYLEAKVEDGAVILRPRELIGENQAWFWTKEWQEEEKQADEDIKTGRISQVFDTAEEAIKSLKAGKL